VKVAINTVRLTASVQLAALLFQIVNVMPVILALRQTHNAQLALLELTNLTLVLQNVSHVLRTRQLCLLQMWIQAIVCASLVFIPVMLVKFCLQRSVYAQNVQKIFMVHILAVYRVHPIHTRSLPVTT
jgi:hypothetical protein